MAVLDKLSVPVNGDNAGTLMPKLQYRFRVSFINLGDGDTSIVTNSVQSVQRPNLTHDDITIDTYNSRIYLAGKHAWDPITIELRDEVTSQTSKLLDQQIAKQIDMAAQSSPKAGVSYKFQVEIENLNGGNPNPEVLDVWKLSGCFIQNISYSDSSYADGGAYQTISISIRYDNAEHIANNEDMLSNPSYQVDPNSQTGSTT